MSKYTKEQLQAIWTESTAVEGHPSFSALQTMVLDARYERDALERECDGWRVECDKLKAERDKALADRDAFAKILDYLSSVIKP